MQYKNPLIPCDMEKFPGRTGDPYVLFYKGEYYHCFSMTDGVYLSKSKSLTDIGKAHPIKVYHNSPNELTRASNWFAPELHLIDGDFYIYGAPDINDKGTHAMRVLRLKGDNPIGEYELLGGIEGIGDVWSIDGTVITLGGKRYFVWTSNHIYIAEMVSPTKIGGVKTAIIKAEYDWEKVGQPITEGPAPLMHDGKTYIIYSASDSKCDGYCLGYIEYSGGDPLDENSWKKYAEPILVSVNGVHGPGHCSFTTVEIDDKAEDFVVYHANLVSGTGWMGRSVWTQKVLWEGGPRIGTPLFECEY